MPTGVYPRTEYHKKIYSESANPYWKGKKMPLWLRKKLSESHKGETRSEEWKEKMSAKFSGKGNPAWNGGVHLSRGYRYIHVPLHPRANKGGYVQESYLVIESITGRCVQKNEAMHRINKITDDNRPENLMLFSSQAAHKRFEAKGKVKKSEILFDGKKEKKR